MGDFNKRQLFLKLNLKQNADCNNMAEMCTKLGVTLKTVNPVLCSSMKQCNERNTNETEKISRYPRMHAQYWDWQCNALF